MEEMRKKGDENGGDTTEIDSKETVLDAGADADEEYTPDEILKLVESSSPTITTEINGTNFPGEANFRVRFTDDPYAVPVIVQSYSGYITINVNEESCGPSFSDSDASAMASIDASGLFGFCLEYAGEEGGAWSENEARASEHAWDDDLLARFLGEDCV